jgi:hypothetical protein
MCEFCKRLCFTTEAFCDNRIIGNTCAQQLDSNFTTQVCVGGTPYVGHTTGRNASVKAIATTYEVV